MSSSRRLVALPLFVFAFATLTSANSVDPTLGVPVVPGSRVSTSIGAPGDVDDYVVRGVPGQALRIRVRPTSRPRAAFGIELLRDGESVARVDGARLDATLADAGVHVIRVRAIDGQSVGRYRLSVTGSRPLRSAGRRSADPSSGALEFDVVAGPGMSVRFDVRVLRGEITSVGTLGPDATEFDALSGLISSTDRSIRLSPTTLPDDAPAGTYRVRLESNPDAETAQIRYRVSSTPAHASGAARRLTLAALEPVLTSVPDGAVPGERVAIGAIALDDPAAPGVAPRFLLGGVECTDVRQDADQVWSGALPQNTPLGSAALVVVTGTGQSAHSSSDVWVARRPRIDAVEPGVTSVNGESVVTLRGEGFPTLDRLAIALDGAAIDAGRVVSRSGSELRFVIPPHASGTATIVVHDTAAGIASLPAHLDVVGTPVAFRVAPSAVSTDEIAPGTLWFDVLGEGFAPTDHLWLGRSGGGEDDLSVNEDVYVDANTLRATLSPRGRGRYAVRVTDTDGPGGAPIAALRVFAFDDASAIAGALDGATTTAVFDADGDGVNDVVVAHVGGDTVATTRATRLFLGRADGTFEDASDAMLPGVTATDDLRADVVRAADVDGDGWTDLLVATDSTVAPSADASHLRLWLNRPAPGDTPLRVFEDVTATWLPAPRSVRRFGSNAPIVADAWSARDVWVGDLDGNGGRPEILITHDAVEDIENIFSESPELSPGLAALQWAAHRGGTRLFRFDSGARDGLGAFREVRDAFPRREGVRPSTQWPVPPEFDCSRGCSGTFLPLRGTSLAVADVDGDGRRDVVVVSPRTVQRRDAPGDALHDTPSLQIALRRRDAGVYGAPEFEEAPVTLSGDLRADHVAVFRATPESGHWIALGRSAADDAATRPLRLLHAAAGEGGTVVLTDADDRLPPATDDPSDVRALVAHDVDADGRDDLVFVTSATGGGAGLRVLRARGVTTAFEAGYAAELGALTGGATRLVGRALTIGALAGDELTSLVVVDADGHVRSLRRRTTH